MPLPGQVPRAPARGAHKHPGRPGCFKAYHETIAFTACEDQALVLARLLVWRASLEESGTPFAFVYSFPIRSLADLSVLPHQEAHSSAGETLCSPGRFSPGSPA